MESKVFDLKPLGRTLLNSYYFSGVRSSSELCSFRGLGFNPKASNSIKTSKVYGPVTQEILEAENCIYRIYGNGSTNGSNSSLFSRHIRVLDALDDEYEGVIVNPERLPTCPIVFASILRSSIFYWKTKGKKGIWLKLPAERCEFVPVAVKEGFEYHHAERGYVMMTYWIPEGPCMLPDNASHQVGVGGFVLNDKNEVLVVQEKYCPPAMAALWKLPTGFIHASEEIFSGAIREVKEETGIDTEFVEVIAFRHAHNIAFEKSDLLFICMLKPKSTQIMVDDLEVQAAKWMPLAEFIKQPLIQGDDMLKKIINICILRMEKRYCGLSSEQVISKFDGKSSSLYYNIFGNEASEKICYPEENSESLVQTEKRIGAYDAVPIPCYHTEFRCG